jgi:nucleoside 2-deoxyribosyltransferase
MKLYLAGPDVFLPDATEIGKLKQKLCSKYGFVGLFPLDNEVIVPAGAVVSKAIFDGNIAMLEEADAVVANLTPFRGISADVGTVFEVGYGFARRKKIYGYSNIRAPYSDRVREFLSDNFTRGSDGRLLASDGHAVEDFGLFENLMIAEALSKSGGDIVLSITDPPDPLRDLGTFEECLRRIRARLSSTHRADALVGARR